MRPFIKFHATAGAALRYPVSTPRISEYSVLGGTIHWQGASRTTAELNQILVGDPAAPPKPWMHITLSLPPKFQLNDTEWKEIIRLMFEALGLPAVAIPFIAFKHPSGKHNAVEHVHIVALPKLMTGEWLNCQNLRVRCDRAANAIACKLGLSQPTNSPLVLSFPKRRQKTDEYQHICLSVNFVLRSVQPTDFAEFRNALSAFFDVSVDLKQNCYGVDSFVFGYQGALLRKC